AGIDMQVLSINAPGTEQLDAAEALTIARESNEFLGAAVKKHPKRFAGLAALPTMVPDKAAAELERCVRELGFRGALINGHVRGRYMDDKFFWPIFERAEALNVPIYMHPTRPPQAVVEAEYSGFSPEESWVFARDPKLQIVVGHLSEGLSFMLPRLDRNFQPPLTKLQRTLGDYLRQNVHYTFGGFNFPATFLGLLLEVGAERIMFSVDHP